MKLKLVQKQQLTEDVWNFRFRAHDDLPTFEAGQYGEIELPHDQPDDGGTTRYFTNSAAPYENVFQITTRISHSSFKQALKKLNSDDEVTLSSGPDGEFTWRENDPRPKLFVAGGIGVTPFHSMLTERAQKNESMAATLLYAGRSKESLPFTEEFSRLESEHPEFSIVYATDETLSASIIADNAPNIKQSVVYLSGPEDMVESIGEDLSHDFNLNDDQLVQDFFPGYDDTNY